jgi:aminopeptidase YwaD
VFSSQFVFYKKIFDPFFSKALGYNISGFVEPDHDVQQQIILCGHHDAAYVFHYMAISPRLYPFVVIGGVLSLLLGIGLSLTCIIMSNPPGWIPTVMAASFVLVLPLWWFTTDTVSPGAGDNMIAVALANEVTRVLADSKKSGNNLLRHTRIVCLSVDAEESGLRGSMAYVARHAKDLTATKSYVLCLDTLYNADKLIFFNNDMNLTTDLSDSMANDLNNIARELGYGARVARMPWGGGSTDAASFARGGIEATCMLAFDLNVGKLPKDLVYHTLKDTTNAIEPAIVEQAINVTIDYILKKDKEISR